MTPYGRVEGAAPSATCTSSRTTRFSPTYLRSATAYGVSPRLRGDLVVNNLAGYAFTTGRVLIMSDGTPWRPLVHIEDIARAFLAALEAPLELVHDEAFNVGRTEENFQVRELGRPGRGDRARTAPSSTREGGGPDLRCYRVELLEDRRDAARFRAAVDRAARDRGALRRLPALRARRASELRERPLPAHPAREGAPGRRASSTRTCAAADQRLPPADGAAAPAARRRSRSSCALGELPLPDALLREDQLAEPEPRYPLDLAVLPRLRARPDPRRRCRPSELFVDNYLYFSSYSDDLLRHAREAALEALAEELRLGPDSLVVEIASNDGYLLRNFVELGVPGARDRPGARPRRRRREAAGVPTLREFFGTELARRLRAEGRRADAIVANNVLAHTPDPNDLVAGHRASCSPTTAWSRSRTRTSAT